MMPTRASRPRANIFARCSPGFRRTNKGCFLVGLGRNNLLCRRPSIPGRGRINDLEQVVSTNGAAGDGERGVASDVARNLRVCPGAEPQGKGAARGTVDSLATLGDRRGGACRREVLARDF